MITANPVPEMSRASAIAEAQALVRQCAEPCPAGTNIKGAIRKASKHIGMPYSRARNIWYGEARRIEAAEMDQLRRGAEIAGIAQAVAGVEILRGMLASRFPDADRILAELAATLREHRGGSNELGQ
ncbi:hypothetical protein [Bradyrhizobium australiense]|uniref:Uncharacterized protein n=1 Tax=Bradyrhizobium australiense TaxID=2721161 RepID=A0A7Y4GWK9_9BRAD|nr:hypothetical protein [Bradyrhizobium australiense]NOJ43310.1 hypothetical protein [Bradyrhizobium australiense]